MRGGVGKLPQDRMGDNARCARFDGSAESVLREER